MNSDILYDVVIVGAGPAGLFASYELAKNKNLNIALIDWGKRALKRKCPISNGDKCYQCNPCHIMAGLGGAGTYSDGKLNFIPKLGKTDLYQFLSKTEAENLIKYCEDIFNFFGMDSDVYPKNIEEAQEYKKTAIKNGLDLLLIRQKHLGSDNLPNHIEKMTNFLENSGVNIFQETQIVDLFFDDVKNFYILKTKNNKEFLAKNVILAPGRVGADWLQKTADRLGISYNSRSIEIGVRVELRNEIMKDITNIIYDPTFFIKTKTYDDEIRTFCTNPGGYVAKENYQDFICVNGHALTNKKSQNTNFAFISKVDLTMPATNTRAFGESIGKIAQILGDGKPIIQRLGDLKAGKRSTWERINRGFIEPTLKDVVPGDIALVLPHRTVSNIIEGLEKLDRVIKGVYNDDTLLYAPEIKFFSIQIETNKNLETKCKGLYTIGDGAGVSGNIVSAACTGLIAAKDILSKK